MSKFNKFRFEFHPSMAFMINLPELSTKVQELSRGRGRLVTDLANGIVEVYGVMPSHRAQVRIRMPPEHMIFILMDRASFNRGDALKAYGLK
ncbi:hypothetical protein MYOV003v1_p0012 [Vibrio phage 207E48.1]|nr:hypothetical protein MYOV003v1_p0012 [Vibrio phage 207E48.1]